MHRWKNRVACIASALFFVMVADPVLAESEVYISGGGIIREAPEPELGLGARKITFAVDILVADGGQAAGHLHFNFHDTNDNYGLDQSKFMATNFTEIFIQTNYLDVIHEYTFVRMIAYGRLDGEEGWSVLVRFSDFGPPNRARRYSGNLTDAVRIMLFAPGSIPDFDDAIYDTAFDYPREQSWRTLLDGGNFSVFFQADAE